MTIFLTLLLCWAVADDSVGNSNPLLDELTGKGVEVGDGQFVPLPAPTFSDAMTPDEKKKAVESLEQYGDPVRLLLRDSASAPFALKIADSALSQPGYTIRTVDLWFVLHGQLQNLEKDELFEGLLDAGGGEGELADRARELQANELADLGIATVKDGEKYVFGEYTLLERVRLIGVVRSLRTRGANSIVLASVMESSIDSKSDFACRWRPVLRDNLGQTSLGDSNPYRGFACYIKVTPLAEPPGALIAEYHAVLNEPQGWFDGRAVLKAKLPILVRDQVESFRRRLRNAER